ncbi:phosphate system positive regulatory protein pho81, partial [Gryganskiella cystojenkinii]
MKFGKQIQIQQIPEWQSHYMSYKGLKKIINSLLQEKAQNSVTIAASPMPGSSSIPEQPEDEHSKFLQLQKAEFFFKLERELEKVSLRATISGLQQIFIPPSSDFLFFHLTNTVNAFYLQKESELKVRLRSLVDKEKVLLSRQGRPGTGSSIHSLQEAFRQFEQDLSKLQKFVQTNGTGFRKILKKWDKRSKSTTKELYLARQIDLQPCFSQDAMVELADGAAMHLLGLENLQQSRALSAPSSPMTGQPLQNYQASAGGSVSSPVQQQMDELETDILNALTTGQTSVVQELLDRRVATPSTLAINSNIERGVKIGIPFVRLGIENAREVLTRVFWRCCSEKDVPDAAIQLLVRTGLVDFKFVDDISDRTCLHEAAMIGRLDLIKLGVEHGVSPESSDVYGRRPLHYVSMYGYSECADYLLSLKVSTTAMDHDGFRPLIYSVMSGHSRCVELFLDNNVEIEASREGDPIPLGLACQFGHEDIAMMLIDRGANVRASNADGLEPLHITCREGHVRLTRTLTIRGAQLNQEDKYMCWTPLFYAASEGHVDCVKILLEAGCDVNGADEHKKTPIYYAASEGHADCVELMIQAGGRVEGGHLEDSVMSTPAHVSATGVMVATAWPTTIDFAASDVSDDRITALDIADGVDDQDVDMDMIPSLSLPPPIIPFRIYGHNYLDKRYQINLTLGHGTTGSSNSKQVPVRLYGTAQISSLKLVISSRPDMGMIPHNVILPLGENRKVYGFQVDSLQQFTVEFDIFPTYGSKAIGRAVALPSMFSSKDQSVGKGILPLLDSHLKVVGELAFEFSVVRPFQGVRLEVGGRLETYWKSTNTIDSITAATTTVDSEGALTILPVSTSTSRGILPHPTTTQPTLSGNLIPSFITASSLSGEYIQLSIQMTRDFVPVVFSDWLLPVPGFDLSISDVSFEQFKRYEGVFHQRTSNDDLDWMNAQDSGSWTSGEWRHRIYERWMSLEQVLK